MRTDEMLKVEEAVELAVADERERCAKIAERISDEKGDMEVGPEFHRACSEIAAKIRED